MTKSIVILKIFTAKRMLESICQDNNISYKFCHAVIEGKKTPSWDLMNKFRFLMPTDYWFDKATNEFLHKICENMDVCQANLL